jgi:hypothetical protein
MVRIERDVREFWAGRALNKVAGKPGGRGARHGDGRAATAQKLLEMRMVAAVSEAAENAGRASQPEFAFPNLLEGLERAASVCSGEGNA